MAGASEKSAVDVVRANSPAFFDFLKQSNYAVGTQNQYRAVITHFLAWLSRMGYGASALFEASRAYICSRTDVTMETRARYRAGLNGLLRYLCDQQVIDPPCGEGLFVDLEDDFGIWLVQEHDIADVTVKQYQCLLRRFLGWCPTHGVDSMGALSPEHIENFFIEAGTLDFGRSFKRRLRTSMRHFLRFCFERRHCVCDLSGSVPCVRVYSLADVPRAIAEPVAQALLSDVDHRAGARDCAIIRLLYEYGVRACQVQRLKLSDIDWREESIAFQAVKNGRGCSFPLTATVGNALFAYLKERPKQPVAEVFLTCHAPYKPLDSRTISGIVSRGIKRLAIDSPVTGAHGFRHAFAKRLLRQEVPLKHLADLLGHRSLQSTFIYTKVDFDALADVALELPEVDL